MFGRAPKNELPPEEVPASVIPAEFYAGASPVIHFPKAPVPHTPSTSLPPASASEPQRPQKPVNASATPGTNKPSVFANRAAVIGGGVGLFVLFVAGASVYYWFTLSANKTPDVRTPPDITVTVSTTDSVVVPTTSISNTDNGNTTVIPSSTPTSLLGGSLVFPSRSLGRTMDTDNDGLSDEEEELFTTDPKSVDSDKDSYPDGVEIYNLYSPVDAAPAKLFTTSLVAQYTNPSYGYNVLYPTKWAQGAVNPDNSDIIFSTLTGENVEIRAFVNQDTFANWFALWAPNERFDDLVPFSTRQGLSGFKRSDNLVFYFPTANRIYVIAYNPGKDQTVYYPSVPLMIARSFELPLQNAQENPRDIQVPQIDLLPPTAASQSSSPAAPL